MFIIRRVLLIISLLAVGMLAFVGDTKAASCTGSGYNCWEYNRYDVCVDQGLDKPCELNTTGTACYYYSADCCATSGRSCTYSSGTTPTPTPAPTTAPTTPPSSITMQTVVALDKNRNGVFDDGYYQVIEDPADTNCGTFPNITGLTVSYSGAASGTINYHTGCVGSTYNYPYSTKAIAAAGNFTFTLSGIPSNYSLKWVEEGTGKCTLSGGVVTCTGLVSGQTYGIWFFLQETGVPNCKNLTGPTSLYVGETGTFTATYEDGTGSIDQRGLAIYSEGQCEPNTSAYWNRIDGGPGTQSFNWVPSAAGTYDVDCRAWDAGVSECRGRCYGIAPYYTYQCVGTGGGATTTRKVTVLSPVLSWWQVKDSDILANGDVRSNVPASNYFDLAGSGGFPGVPIFSGATNLTSTNVSAKKWMAKTSYVSNKVYGSSYFINLIPAGATINNVTSTSVPGSFFASGGTAYNGYYWYVYDGAANGGVDLTITSGASLGARKVILIVKNANLNLQGNINLTKGSGFFLGITSGNLNVSPTVGGAGPNLEGIYIADGTFSSGTGGTKTDSQLSVRGTVAAYGGINLQRDLGNVNNSTTPAEYFEYAPDLELLFPKELATRVTNWREVAP